MSIAMNTHFFPYKIDLQDRQPVRMDIEVINRYTEPKRVNLEVLASNQIGLNKTLAQKEKYELGKMNAGESKTVKLDVIPKNFAMQGQEEIHVIATEITLEETGYSFASKKFRKRVGIEIK